MKFISMFMKKFLIVIVIILGLLGIYLNRSYAHIYNFISAKNLPNPTAEKLFAVDNNKTEKIKIAFLGDSLTVGVGANSAEKTFPRLVAQKLSNKYNLEILNLGVPGAKTTDVLDYQVKLANDFKPDKIVLFIGINDMNDRLGLAEVKNNIEDIYGALKITKENFYLVNIPFLGSDRLFLPPWQSLFFQQTKRYNKIFDKLEKSGYQVVDLFSQTASQFVDSSSWYSADYFHPNDAGYELIADEIFKNLRF